MAKDPYRFFRIEARELVEQMTSGMMGLEDTQADATALAKLLRLAHTLKGAARVVRQAEIADLAHAVEDHLTPYREGGQALTRELVEAVLARLDAINAALAKLPNPSEDTQMPAASSGIAPTAPPVSTRLVRTDLAELTELTEGLGEIGRELNDIAGLATLLAQSRELASELTLQLGRRGDMPSRAGQLAALHDRAEQMVDLMTAAERKLGLGVERVGRELAQARETADRLRLIPAASVFSILERTCRDAAQSVNKRANFEMTGGDILLDGQVLEVLQGALVQLVRNAIAHGIESPAERVIAGKPERGSIALQVCRRGYRVVFRCVDDGRGVDYAAVKKAVLRPEAPEPDRPTLLAMLFQGGVSTASAVTQLAGRGIGLDVVREAMVRLGGALHADSEPGRGTSVELRVPVSLAAFDALLVEQNGLIAALPLESVVRTLRLASDEVVHSSDGDAIMYDGGLIPLVTPGLPGRRTARGRRVVSAVLLSVEGRVAAVAVERMLGTESIVLRPLPALAKADPLILGCSLDAEGSPRLVLDPAVLVNGHHRGREDESALNSIAHPILIVDDSLTTRMLEQSILESAGLPVETAASAEEALELARRNSYSLFLVDVEMPGMDGFSFVEQTRADPRLFEVPCIMVTSCDTPEHRERGAIAGASAYIVKSQFDQVEFLQHIHRLAQS